MSNNELYEHKRSDTVKWVLTLLAFILVGVMLAGIILGWFDKKEEEPPAEQEQTEQAAVTDGDGNAMDEDIVYPMPAKMSFSAASFAEPLAQFGEPSGTTVTPDTDVTSQNSVEVLIEATVTPANATNREVDFSITWGDGAQRAAEPVTDYVTVTPESDGSRIATVVCKKGFGDDTILITVTTRDGGFQAICTVTFEGVPDSLKFVYGDREYVSTSEITVRANAEYSVGLKLEGKLGEVGEQFGDFEIVNVTMQGKFNAKRKAINNGATVFEDSIVIDLEDPYYYAYDIAMGEDGNKVTFDASQFIECSIEGDTLKVRAIRSEESFVYPSMPPRTGTRVTYESAYYDPRGGGAPSDCRMCVLVRDKTSGVEGLLYIDIEGTAVNGVSLSETELEF